MALVNWKTVSRPFPAFRTRQKPDEYGLEYETVTFIFPQPLHFPLFKQFFIPRTVFYVVLIEERFLATEQFFFFSFFPSPSPSSSLP